MNKLIIPIIIAAIIAAGIGTFFVFQKPASIQSSQPQQPISTPKTSTSKTAYTTVTSTSNEQISEDSPFGIHDPKVRDRPLPLEPTTAPPGYIGFDEPEDIAKIGVKWIRYAGAEGLVWGEIEKEKEKGKYDWARTDYMFLEAYKADLNLLVAVGALDSSSVKKKYTQVRLAYP